MMFGFRQALWKGALSIGAATTGISIMIHGGQYHIPATCSTNDIVTERESSKTFSKIITMASGVEGALIGTACRRRFGLIPVYSVGLYISKSDVKSIPSPESILHGLYEAELQLKFCRKVEVETMVASIQEAMKVRVDTEQHNAVDNFSEALKDLVDGPLHDGTTLGFHWESSVLTVYIEEDDSPRRDLGIRSEILSRAVFAVYLDANAVVPREKFVQGLSTYRDAPAQ